MGSSLSMRGESCSSAATSSQSYTHRPTAAQLGTGGGILHCGHTSATPTPALWVHAQHWGSCTHRPHCCSRREVGWCLEASLQWEPWPPSAPPPRPRPPSTSLRRKLPVLCQTSSTRAATGTSLPRQTSFTAPKMHLSEPPAGSPARPKSQSPAWGWLSCWLRDWENAAGEGFNKSFHRQS